MIVILHFSCELVWGPVISSKCYSLPQDGIHSLIVRRIGDLVDASHTDEPPRKFGSQKRLGQGPKALWNLKDHLASPPVLRVSLAIVHGRMGTNVGGMALRIVSGTLVTISSVTATCALVK